MRVAIFSTKHYDRVFLEAANATCGHELVFFEPRLTEETTLLAAQYPVVCVFVNDQLSAPVLTALAGQGTRLIALRSAGFNNVDLIAARELGLTVVRVPAYSPHAVAEHTLGDRKSTRLNSSHLGISYAVFCLKKKNKNIIHTR